MKCQKCEKPATFHITELEGGKHHELHFCEDCARQYLTQGSVETTPATMAGALAQHLAVGQTAEELARLDQKACPVCGITFTSSAIKVASAVRTTTSSSRRSSSR